MAPQVFHRDDVWHLIHSYAYLKNEFFNNTDRQVGNEKGVTSNSLVIYSNVSYEQKKRLKIIFGWDKSSEHCCDLPRTHQLFNVKWLNSYPSVLPSKV